MNKVTPAIYNGDLKLIISEVFICDPSQGLQVDIPLTVEKKATFKFAFKTIETDLNNRDVQVDTFGENKLVFTLNNFLNSVGSSLTSPFEFNVNNDKFFLQLFGVSTGDNVLCLTLSIFKGKNA